MNRGKKIKRYPWLKWFAKGKFTLVRGRDFSTRSYAMAQMVRNVAWTYNLRVHIVIADDEESISINVMGRGNGRANHRKNG